LVKLRKNKNYIRLIYKENKEQKIDSAKEIELDVKDFEEAKAFCLAIGLVAYRVIEKYRHTLILDGVALDIDTWPQIPVLVELEGDSVENLKKVAEKLDFDWEKRFDGDPREVYKSYGYDFDNIHTLTFAKVE
jgi:adenylate cyclase class IV